MPPPLPLGERSKGYNYEAVFFARKYDFHFIAAFVMLVIVVDGDNNIQLIAIAGQ